MLEFSCSSSPLSSENSPSPNRPMGHSSGDSSLSSQANPMLSMINTLNLQDASKQLGQYFSQSASPLSALHSMSDLKLGLSASSLAEHSLQSSPYGAVNSKVPVGPPSSAPSPPMHSSSASATSHYINDILSRPASLVAAGSMANSPNGSFGSALANSLPKFPLPSVPGSVCFNAAAAAAAANGLGHKINSLNELPNRHIYWPSMVQNSNLWRERLANAVNQNCSDKDNKKKHTRPTFSGHQIYVLEKTFEQTKYLAGPERAKLAYALGMSESQVKVWFQNRRTKWRKRHAAELATAKKKNQNTNEAELLAEEDYSSDEEMDEKTLKSKDQYAVHNSVRLPPS